MSEAPTRDEAGAPPDPVLRRLGRLPPTVARATLRAVGEVRPGFLDRRAAAIALRETGEIVAFLRWCSRLLGRSAMRRVANRIAAAQRHAAPGALHRLAHALRSAPGIDPVVVATILFNEARRLHDLRAAHSALDVVLDLRSERFAPAMAPAFAGDVAVLEARLRHRLDDVGRARAALAAAPLTPSQQGAATELDAVMTYPTDEAEARAILERRFAVHGFGSKECNTLYAELLRRAGRLDAAEAFLAARRADAPRGRGALARARAAAARAECLPGLANLALDRGDVAGAKDALAAYWAEFGLELAFGDGPPALETLAPPAPPPVTGGPLVSVVMTAWRAEAHVGLAVASVLAQSWREIELIVVDDASDDGTAEVVAAMAARDPRIRLVRRARNAGTYVAKNEGIAQARGAFVALHDSDDWWHPRHLERHLAVMTADPRLRFTSSAWLRMDATGRVALKHNGGYLHFNPASTLFRAEVFREIGYFDSVRIGADTEFVWRLRQVYGRVGEVELREPLAIGRVRDASLTQSGPGAYNANNVSPTRLAYWESWSGWHRRCALGGETPRLPPEPPADPAGRLFPAPAAILP